MYFLSSDYLVSDLPRIFEYIFIRRMECSKTTLKNSIVASIFIVFTLEKFFFEFCKTIPYMSISFQRRWNPKRNHQIFITYKNSTSGYTAGMFSTKPDKLITKPCGLVFFLREIFILCTKLKQVA